MSDHEALRIIPEEWDESPLSSTGHGPIDFDAKEGFFANNFKAGQLNAIAEYAFARSRPLFEIADRGKDVTLSPAEIRTLADSFEEVAFQLGDGVLFDSEQSQKFSCPGIMSFVRRALHRAAPRTA